MQYIIFYTAAAVCIHISPFLSPPIFKAAADIAYSFVFCADSLFSLRSLLSHMDETCRSPDSSHWIFGVLHSLELWYLFVHLKHLPSLFNIALFASIKVELLHTAVEWLVRLLTLWAADVGCFGLMSRFSYYRLALSESWHICNAATSILMKFSKQLNCSDTCPLPLNTAKAMSTLFKI